MGHAVGARAAAAAHPRRRRRRRLGRGRAARALRRRVDSSRSAPRSRPTSRSCATATALTGSELLDACRDAADLPQALAAVDLALWDRAGNREGRPVAELLSDDPSGERPRQRDDRGRPTARGAAAQAAAAPRAGYSCVKVKVGVGDDAGRVAAVRAAVGAEMELRLDANGAWEVDEAVATIEALAPAGLELVEEPVHGVAPMRAVRDRVAVRVAMDETARRARLADREGRRRRVPEGRRAAAGSPACSPRPRSCARRAPTSTSPRRSTARSASPPRCTARRRCARRRVRARDARRCSPTSSRSCRCRRARSRCPTSPGLGV